MPESSNIQVICDLNTKKWLTMEEASIYSGHTSYKTFQEWRKGVEIPTGNGIKRIKLKYYKIGRKILYKREDIDRFLEECHSAINRNVLQTNN